AGGNSESGLVQVMGDQIRDVRLVFQENDGWFHWASAYTALILISSSPDPLPGGRRDCKPELRLVTIKDVSTTRTPFAKSFLALTAAAIFTIYAAGLPPGNLPPVPNTVTSITPGEL